MQFNLRSATNAKHNMSVTKPLHTFSVGDRVFIISDLTKLRSREEYIITSLFSRKGEDWAVVHKAEKQFRQKSYEVQLLEIIPVSDNFSSSVCNEDSHEEDSTPMFGFSSQEVPKNLSDLQKAVIDLQSKVPTTKGRPKLRYPDYIKDDYTADSQESSQTEPFHGFPTQTKCVKSSLSRNVLLHGYIELSDDDDDDDFFYDCRHRLEESDDSDDEESIISEGSGIPNYTSSDDDPANQASGENELWWECDTSIEEHNLQTRNVLLETEPEKTSSIRQKSETDPYLLMRAAIVSTDVSSLDSSDDSDFLDTTLLGDSENTATKSC